MALITANQSGLSKRVVGGVIGGVAGGLVFGMMMAMMGMLSMVAGLAGKPARRSWASSFTWSSAL